MRTEGGSAGMGAIGLVLAAGAIAVVLGLAPAALSLPGTIGLAVLGLGAVAMVLFRQVLRGASPPRSEAPAGAARVSERSDRTTTPDPILRIPRLLFYLGALTVTQASLRPALGLTVSELFFIASFGAGALAAMAGRPVSRVPSALVLGAGLFALGGLISSPGAASPAGSLSEVMQGIYVMLLWAWTGATVLRTRPQVILALTLWTLSAAFDGFAAITQVLGSEALGGALEASRATGLTSHPNDLGAACAVALVPALMLATSRFPRQTAMQGALMPTLRWLILALVAAGLVLSASVAAMVAGLIAILAWLVAPAVRAPGRLAVIAGIAFALIALTLAAGRITSPTERLKEVTDISGTQPTAGSGGIRIKTAKRALPRIEDNPVVGTGLDSAGGVVNVINQGNSTQYQVHGAPIAVWYEAGIFGLLGFLTVIVTLARRGWQSLTAEDQNDVVIGLAIFAAFTAFIIYALTSPFVFQQYGWFSGVMIIAWGARRDAHAAVFILAPQEPPAVPEALPGTVSR